MSDDYYDDWQSRIGTFLILTILGAEMVGAYCWLVWWKQMP